MSLRSETSSAELQALAPSFKVSWCYGGVENLDIRMPGERLDENERQLAAVLDHPDVRLVRQLDVQFFFSAPREDIRLYRPRWALEAVAARRFPLLDGMFVSASGPVGIDPLASAFQQPAVLGTSNPGSYFGEGPFANMRVLDLRDGHVEWHPSDRFPSWPDLEILILRPRGNRKDRWAEQVLRSAQPFPKLREVWAVEGQGDMIVGALVASPLLGQLRRIDLTGSVTNAGAAVLHENASNLEALEEICLGTPGEDRRELIKYARVTNPSFEEPPMGAMEIDDAWRSRLRQRLGRRATFDVAAGYPHLDIGVVLRGKRLDEL
jgi:hypothetical protein